MSLGGSVQYGWLSVTATANECHNNKLSESPCCCWHSLPSACTVLLWILLLAFAHVFTCHVFNICQHFPWFHLCLHSWHRVFPGLLFDRTLQAIDCPVRHTVSFALPDSLAIVDLMLRPASPGRLPPLPFFVSDSCAWLQHVPTSCELRAPVPVPATFVQTSSGSIQLASSNRQPHSAHLFTEN